MVSSRSMAGEAPISPLPDLSHSPFCRLLPRCFAIGRKRLASARTRGCHRPQKRRGEEPSFTREQALCTGVFWLLCAAGFLTNAIGTALLLNHFSIMQTAGIAHSDALLLLSLLAGVQAAATLGTGFLLDRYEPRHLVPLAMLMLALASGLPAFGGGIAISVLYALSLGGAYGSQQAINAAGYAQYFGRDHLGAIRGASFVFGIAGAAFGPLPFAEASIGQEAMLPP